MMFRAASATDAADTRSRSRSMRLSTRLLLIVLTCLLQVIAFGVWAEYSHWQERRAELGALALQQAQLLDGDIESIADAAADGGTLLRSR